MFAAYSDCASELARPQMLATFESRLKETGLWEGFPDRRDFGSLEDYARALEVHAGVPQGSALRISGNGILFDPAPDGRPDERRAGNECVRPFRSRWSPSHQHTHPPHTHTPPTL